MTESKQKRYKVIIQHEIKGEELSMDEFGWYSTTGYKGKDYYFCSINEEALDLFKQYIKMLEGNEIVGIIEIELINVRQKLKFIKAIIDKKLSPEEASKEAFNVKIK